MNAPLLLLALASPVPPQDAAASAEALLERREAALGTSEARAKVRGIAVEGSVSVSGTEMKARFEELYLVERGGVERGGVERGGVERGAPERVLLTTHWDGWGATTMGTDGQVSWSTDPGFGILVKEGSEQGAPRRLWAIQRSAPWRSLYESAKVLGEVERGGRKLVELEMQPADGKPERWFLDARTNELARVAVVYPGPSGEVLPMEFTFGDWRAVDGVLYPFERTQEILGSGAAEGAQGTGAPLMAIVYRCESVRHVPDLSAEKLVPPADVLAAIADSSKRAQKPGADAEACTVETREPQVVATVRAEIPTDEVSQNLAVMFTEVMGALSEQGVQTIGPPFSRIHSIDRETKRMDLEAGVPVRTRIEPQGRVAPSELPGGKVATTWHVGPYHELQRSHDRLGKWIETQSLKSRGGFWEIYWTDPSLEPDPSAWRTQVLWPVE
jgi:effector-binding domain-containing protein